MVIGFIIMLLLSGIWGYFSAKLYTDGIMPFWVSVAFAIVGSWLISNFWILMGWL